MTEKNDTSPSALEGGQLLGRQLTSITLSPEQFEQLYLQPKNATSSRSLGTQLGNPPPLGMTSFILVLFPFSCSIMGFGGANSLSLLTQIGGYYLVGGLGLILASIMEWVAGNTFPSVVFFAYGGFIASFGFLLQPDIGIAAAIGGAVTNGEATGAAAVLAATPAPVYNVGVALYLTGYTIISFMLTFAALRTNLAFFLALFTLSIAFALFTSGYFAFSQGNFTAGGTQLIAGGAFAFVTVVCGLWINSALLLASVGSPIQIPVYDLSHIGAKRKQ